jgi:hypothetical protein
MGFLAAITALAGLVLLTALYRRDQLRVRRQRAEFFADCLSVLESPRLGIDAFGYPILTGRFEGVPIRADVIVDGMALRKLPSLWLRITLEAATATGAVVDVMMRPSGSEFFSPFANLPERLETPPDWPERAVVRTDDPSRVPAADTLAPHMDILDEPKGKELLVTPRGVRLVWQADEAQRGDYLLLRQARFDVVRFDRETFGDLVSRCFAIRESLASAARKESPSEAAA